MRALNQQELAYEAFVRGVSPKTAQPTALVPWRERYPFAIDRDMHRRLSAAHSRLAEPDRVEWWMGMGEADGATGRRYGAPATDGPERRAYRIGWVQGTRESRQHEPAGLRACCKVSATPTCGTCGDVVWIKPKPPLLKLAKLHRGAWL